MNIAARKKNAARHSTSSGLLWRTIRNVRFKEILVALRGTTSLVFPKQIRYRTMATTPRAAVVRVNCNRTCSPVVSWNCGATPAESATAVKEFAIDRAPERFDRSTESCVIAADRDPQGMLTTE